MSCPLQTCPLCGVPNDCQLATAGGCAGPCWCATESFPRSLLERVPEEARGVACVCRRCVVEARRVEWQSQPVPPQAGDFYTEGDTVVFTEQYHRRRGYCCESGCRHCPFDAVERAITSGSAPA